MHKLVLMQYINRKLDEAENAIHTEKDRTFGRKLTSEDYFRMAVLYDRYEQISAMARDIYRLMVLYQ